LSDIIFEGNYVTLLDCNEKQAKGVIIACGNTHLFLDHKTIAELLEGLNRKSYEIYKTREEISQ